MISIVLEGMQNSISDLSTNVTNIEVVVPSLSTGAVVPASDSAQIGIDEVE